MKNNEKNGFLIVWVSCVVFLLLLCYIGINVTYSAPVIDDPSDPFKDPSENSGSSGGGNSGGGSSGGGNSSGGSSGGGNSSGGSSYTCPDGYILTGSHCVNSSDRSEIIDATPSSGSSGSSGEILGGCYKPGTCPSGYKWIQVADFAGTNEACGNCVPNASEAECPSFINSADCDCTAYVNSDMKTCYNCTCFDSCPEGFHREGNLCIQDECDCDESDPDCKPEEKPATPVTPSPNPSPNPGTSPNVNPSIPDKYTTTPSSSPNITDNPQTGEIAIFVVWVVAIAAIVYSVYYFKKVNEN